MSLVELGVERADFDVEAVKTGLSGDFTQVQHVLASSDLCGCLCGLASPSRETRTSMSAACVESAYDAQVERFTGALARGTVRTERHAHVGHFGLGRAARHRPALRRLRRRPRRWSVSPRAATPSLMTTMRAAASAGTSPSARRNAAPMSVPSRPMSAFCGAGKIERSRGDPRPRRWPRKAHQRRCGRARACPLRPRAAHSRCACRPRVPDRCCRWLRSMATRMARRSSGSTELDADQRVSRGERSRAERQHLAETAHTMLAR